MHQQAFPLDDGKAVNPSRPPEFCKRLEGTIDHSTVYVREVIRRSLELGAAKLVLAHNHPSFDATPSNADLQLTQSIISAGRPLGVWVSDHIIMSRMGYFSMKEKGMV